MSDRSGEVGSARTEAGLRDLYRRHSAWLTSRLRRRFGDETEDLAQEAWLRLTAYSRRGNVHHPKAFLMRVVENLAIDRRRRQGARPVHPSDRSAPDPVADQADQIDVVFLKQIILTMPPLLREVFVLSRFAHLEYQEISERLNIPVTTVQWRMQKALAYCAAQLRL